VIASRVGGLPEVVEDGSCGLLTENEPRAIAAAISRFLGDPDLANRLAMEGRRRVEECFSLDRMVRETVAVYEKVLS
jgi:starch synthase